ncbi:MAG: hypothetical protein ABIN35_02285 [candidate division WOR-3 bacterium]
MKKFFLILSIFICFIFSFQSNLLLNSDFENWADNNHPLNWFPDSLFPDSFFIERSTFSFSGNYSLKANIFTKNQSLTDIVSEYIPVLPNKVYRIKSYVYDNDQYLYAKIYLNYYGSTYTFLSNNFTLDSVGNSNLWQFFPETLITTPANCYYVRVGFRFYDLTGFTGNGTIYIDSVYFGDTLSTTSSPVITNVQRIPTTVTPVDIVTVSADITDDVSVSTDSLYYRVNGGIWSTVFHDSVKVSKRFFTIPPQTSGTVDYFIIAKDNENNRTVSSTFSYTISLPAKVKKVLFDYTKNQTAGNADWVIDRNYPTPLPQNPTNETDWDGAISAWGFELDTAYITNSTTGEIITFQVFTLPPDSPIRYNSSSPLDLKNFDLYVVCEPQNPFTSTEKTNIFNYIRDGGSLFMIADHVSSDRDGDGWDSPEIWQDFGSDSFGIHFQQVGEGYNNISDSTNIYSTANDTITNGPFGQVSGYFYFHAGTMIPKSLKSTAIALYGTNYSMLTISRYGKGKVAGCGDSSPFDDGTGNPSDLLYDGWNEGVSRKLLLNTTYWLVIDSTDLQGLNELSYFCKQIDETLFVTISTDKDYKEIKLYKSIDDNFKFIDSCSKFGKTVVLKDKNFKEKSSYKIDFISYSGQIEKTINFSFYPEDMNYEKVIFDSTCNLIRFNDNIQKHVKIIDISGKTIFECNTKEYVDVKRLKKGLFFVLVEDKPVLKFLKLR